jgi:hypothetical protein
VGLRERNRRKLRAQLLPLAKIQNGCENSSVSKKGAVQAPSFNKIQQTSTSEPQTFQQESLRNNKFQQTSTGFGTWFGTTRPVVPFGKLRTGKFIRRDHFFFLHSSSHSFGHGTY